MYNTLTLSGINLNIPKATGPQNHSPSTYNLGSFYFTSISVFGTSKVSSPLYNDILKNT